MEVSSRELSQIMLAGEMLELVGESSDMAPMERLGNVIKNIAKKGLSKDQQRYVEDQFATIMASLSIGATSPPTDATN